MTYKRVVNFHHSGVVKMSPRAQFLTFWSIGHFHSNLFFAELTWQYQVLLNVSFTNQENEDFSPSQMFADLYIYPLKTKKNQ